MASVKIGYIDTVHGVCPSCEEETLLVAIVTDYYKCTNCGHENRQYVNGSIKYLKLDDKESFYRKNETERRKRWLVKTIIWSK